MIWSNNYSNIYKIWNKKKYNLNQRYTVQFIKLPFKINVIKLNK